MNKGGTKTRLDLVVVVCLKIKSACEMHKYKLGTLINVGHRERYIQTYSFLEKSLPENFGDNLKHRSRIDRLVIL